MILHLSFLGALIITLCQKNTSLLPAWIHSIHPAAHLPLVPLLILHSLLGNIKPLTCQGARVQWKSGSAALCELIGCSSPKQTWWRACCSGIRGGSYACWIVLPQYRRPCGVVTLPRRTQTDQQWLQINPYSDTQMILAHWHLSFHNGRAWITGQNVPPSWWLEKGCSRAWFWLLFGTVQEVSGESRR